MTLVNNLMIIWVQDKKVKEVPGYKDYLLGKDFGYACCVEVLRT